MIFESNVFLILTWNTDSYKNFTCLFGDGVWVVQNFLNRRTFGVILIIVAIEISATINFCLRSQLRILQISSKEVWIWNAWYSKRASDCRQIWLEWKIMLYLAHRISSVYTNDMRFRGRSKWLKMNFKCKLKWMKVFHWRKQNEILVMAGVMNNFDFCIALQKWGMLSFISFAFFHGFKIQISLVERKSAGDTWWNTHREGPRIFFKIETDRKAYFEWLDLLFIFGCSLLKFFEVSAMVDSYIEHQWHCWPRNGTFNHIDLSNKIHRRIFHI